MAKITTITDFINVINSIKARGRFATLSAITDIKLNKFPTDGSEKVRIADNFTPKAEFKIQFHFGADYERAMAKVLNIDEYNAHDSNRTHLVKNLIMQYLTTQTICLIYMPCNKLGYRQTLNGIELTKEQLEYLNRYKSKSKSSAPLEYRTIGIDKIKSLTFDGNTYEIDIQQLKVSKAI